MACLIISKSNDLHVDFWNHGEIHNSRKSNIRKSNGTFIKMDGEILILTCYHCIEDKNIDNTIYYHDNNNTIQKINAVLKFSLKDLDIAVLKPNKKIDDIKYFDTEQKFCTLDEIDGKNIKITTVTDKDNHNIETTNIDATFVKIEREKYIDTLILNFYFPSIHFTLNKKTELEGLSGSILYQNNIPIGILYSVTNGILSAFPLCFCLTFVKSGISKNKYLSSPIFVYELCEFELDQNEINNCESENIKDKILRRQEITGLYLTNTLNIIYKKKNQNFTFLKGDVILSIDSNIINNDGTIHCNISNYNIDVYTYFLINLYVNDTVDISFIRNNIITSVSISCKNFNDIFSYHMTKSNNFIEYDGFIFTELSIDLIKYYKTQNITLFGNIKKIRDDKINKYVVLVHIDYEYLKKNFKNNEKITSMENLNFPYVNNKILILNKIGNDNIVDLNSLRQILSKKLFSKQSTFCFNMYNQLKDDSYGSTIQIESDSAFTQIIRYIC